MYRFVYTKCLENADEAEVTTHGKLTEEQAIAQFDAACRDTLDICLKNEFLKFKANIHNRKAVFSVESVRIVIAIKKED